MSSIRPELKFTDKSDESQFIKGYTRLGEAAPKTIRVVDKTDYYTVLEEDAQLVAEQIYKTNAVIKTVFFQGKEFKYVTLSPSVFQNFVRMVVFELNYKLEIYDKYWKLLKIASPGNLGDLDTILNSSDMATISLIAALKIGAGNKIGICFVDSFAKQIGVCEYADNELYSNTESLLIQLGVKELLLPESADPEMGKLRQVVERCNVFVSECKPGMWNDKNIEQDLGTLTGSSFSLATNDVASLKFALQCCSALVAYLQLLKEETVFELVIHNLAQYMRLDFSAVRALNIFPASSGGGTSNSIFGLLNHCKTTGGSRMLSQWLKQPLLDVEAIKRRHLLVGLFVDEPASRSDIQDVLKHVPDIVRLGRKLTQAKSKLDDLIRLYQLVVHLPGLVDSLQNAYDSAPPDVAQILEDSWKSQLAVHSSALGKLQDLVETTVDLESLDMATSMSGSSVQINAGFSEALTELSGKLDQVREQLSREHGKVADDLGMEMDKKLKLENHHVHGWCFRLTRTDSAVIRGNKRYQELATVKAGVFFTTSDVRSFSQEMAELQKDYENEQQGVVKEILSIATTYVPVLLKLSVVLSEIDVIISFAHAAAFAPVPYVMPKSVHAINSATRNCDLVNARHPCLEALDDVDFIPNDVKLKNNEQEFLLVTGPNMGGKSTYIRTLGVVALMNQIGSFVPCDEGCEIPIFDCILARVGASDSQLKGVSTFMSEMLEISSILRNASSNSLIIIDELGRGTSTYDGFGLAWAISEYIATKIHAFSVFATHFHELTQLSLSVPTVKNLHVVAHIDTSADSDITLLYKVEPGISDQSFGIHVAEVVKFPSKIIAMAKRKATELDDFVGDEDAYVKEKRTKCSPEEIAEGNAVLRRLLKEWKAQVDVSAMSSEQIVTKLRELTEGDFKSELRSSKFVNEVLQL